MTETFAPAQPMLAMQYNFVLPADYDMAIVDRRIAEKGRALDGLPGLRAKAYLSARRGRDGGENLYAPLYVWDEAAAMDDFLAGPGFAGVADAFGWPSVRVWLVWRARLAPEVAQARFATREIATIAPHAPLEALRAEERDETEAAMATGALAAVAGFEPTTWTRVRFRLWREPPQWRDGLALYDVGHVSLGATGANPGKAL